MLGLIPGSCSHLHTQGTLGGFFLRMMARVSCESHIQNRPRISSRNDFSEARLSVVDRILLNSSVLRRKLRTQTNRFPNLKPYMNRPKILIKQNWKTDCLFRVHFIKSEDLTKWLIIGTRRSEIQTLGFMDLEHMYDNAHHQTLARPKPREDLNSPHIQSTRRMDSRRF